MRAIKVAVAALLVIVGGAAPALACGGLLAPNGSVQLLRTSTFAGYVDGIEHYVTSFEFAGKGGNFGSIIPLPGVPTNVRKGGDWTLQRLQIEVQPPVVARNSDVAVAGTAADSAQVIMEKKIDSLNVTILKGGAEEVGVWAKDNGFTLPPDAPEVLDFYATRSPIFLAARFDLDDAQARGFAQGDGVPVHVTIPTPNPWVPLRILGLGKEASEVVQADVFLLTENAPAMLPAPAGAGQSGVALERQELASRALLADLRSDRGMKWLPEDDMWLSYLKIDAPARELTHDLAIDVSGAAAPSPVAAGLQVPTTPPYVPRAGVALWVWALVALAGGAVVLLIDRVGVAKR